MTRLNLIRITVLAQLALLSLARHVDMEDEMFRFMEGESIPENPYSSLFNDELRPRKRRLRAPVVERKNQVDLLCHGNNTVDNTCTLKN